MAYSVVQNCPLIFQDLSRRAGHTCSSGTYHCVEDELSRIVEVCAEEIWMEAGILSLPTTISLSKICSCLVLYSIESFKDMQIV